MYPTPESAAAFAGILAHLGWDTPYEFKALLVAIEEYLQGSDVAPEDRRSVHSNFVHMALDHQDMMMAFYGCRPRFSWSEDHTQTIWFLPL
jgi:hypothetical protein